MKINNQLQVVSFIMLTTLVVSCMTNPKGLSTRYASDLSPTRNEEIYRLEDSVHTIFHLNTDTLYIGKKFPPGTSKVDPRKSVSTRDAFNEDKETNELIKSCFSTDRIEILKENRVGFILYLYIDSNGIVREVEILVHNKYVKMIYDEEIKCICNTLKGLKKSIPPAYVDFAFHKIGHGFFF